MKGNLRILTISDVQGNLHSFRHLFEREKGKIDLIIHTGNFGFWDNETIHSDKDDSFLKQIVAFSEVLKKETVAEINDLLTITNVTPAASSQQQQQQQQQHHSKLQHGSSDPNLPTNQSSLAGSGSSLSSTYDLRVSDTFNLSGKTTTNIPVANADLNGLKEKLLLSELEISQLQLYLSGTYTLPCPVYTIFGPLDDPRVIHEFQTGGYSIPNLHLIDHTKCYIIDLPLPHQPNIKLYGLGGTLKIHSLFDHGFLNYDISGRTGDLWITMVQIAQMYHNVMSKPSDDAISVFVTHAPVIKTPLLEHLAVITNADFSISQGLHFRYPVMGNGMSFVDSMGGSAGYIESYRLKFSRLRMILGEMWLIVRENILELLEAQLLQERYSDADKAQIKSLMELGLSLFDKIPISLNDSTERIIPLTLSENKEESPEVNKKILKKINDLYFSAYYNLWHFNLCDHLTSQPGFNEQSDYNIMIFNLDEMSNFKLDYCTSQGFSFNFKMKDKENATTTATATASAGTGQVDSSYNTGVRKVSSEMGESDDCGNDDNDLMHDGDEDIMEDEKLKYRKSGLRGKSRMGRSTGPMGGVGDVGASGGSRGSFKGKARGTSRK